MKTVLVLLASLLALVVNGAAAAPAPKARVVYRSDFENGEIAQWTNGALGVTPKGQQFLGPFALRHAALLRLTKLPQHRLMRVRFTLLLIGSLDGNMKDGPDIWGLSVGSAPELVRTTFNIFHLLDQAKRPQSFPDEMPINHPAATGATTAGTHGFQFEFKGAPTMRDKADMTYELEIAFPHEAEDVELRFWSSFTSPVHDESWGLLKAEVEVVPELASRGDAELTKLWDSLIGTDAMRAWDALWRLAEGGPDTLEFVRRQLGAGDGRERIAGVVAGLSSNDPIAKEKAYAAIERLTAADTILLRAALTDPATPPRLREEFDELLADLGAESPYFVARVSRLLRVLHSPDADRLLAELNGAPAPEPGGFARLLWRGSHAISNEHWALRSAFTPDSSRLVTTGSEGTRVWDAATGRGLHLFPTWSTRSLAISPDGRTVAVGDRASRVRTWNLETREPGTLLSGHRGEVWSLAFAPTGSPLISAANDGLRWWENAEPHFAAAVPLSGSPRFLALSPDGRTLALAEGPGSRALVLRDAATGELQRRLAQFPTFVTSVNFSPDGQLVAATPYSGGAIVYSVATGEERFRFEGTKSLSEFAVFSPDGAYLCLAGGKAETRASSPDRGLRVYRLSIGAEVWRFTETRACLSAAFSPDGKRLAGTDVDGNVFAWEIVGR